MTIPNGICVDLETTISSRIPDHVRPPGKKRYETKILEIGAVDWQNPSKTYQALVNPIPSNLPIQTPKDLFEHFQNTYQHPTRTINFWSKVLVKRHSLNRHMFLIEEAPEVWLARQVGHRAKDFIRWHHNPASGPMFVSEKKALRGLVDFTTSCDNAVWLAHNGMSFDFKILAGCSERCHVPIPKGIRTVDTLKLFRKCMPGHKSYSQPVLFEALFKRKYNAHVAIDDAKALATLCQHACRSETLKHSRVQTRTQNSRPRIKREMDLTFSKRMPSVRSQSRAKKPSAHRHMSTQKVTRLRGIGPKTAAALAAVQIFTVYQLTQRYKKSGDSWLQSILPFGAKLKVISESIRTV